MKNFLFFSWIVVAFAMLLYSFTQVSLSLTLSQVSVWQGIQKGFQYVGYFERPLSALFFASIISAMFVLYGFTLRAVAKNIIDRKLLVKIIISVSVILFFSYNAFSYDLFNYIFDAKILTYYHENPYEHMALDYPEDPMLSFMHWTHRVYPYGPVWLLITVPISFIGLGYFLLTFYLFKLLMVVSFILSAFVIEKIAKKTGIDSGFALAAFALNPLVIVESLVSAHNDIVMILLGLTGILLYLRRKFIKSFIFLLSSILLKYATVLLIPAIMIREKFKISKEAFFYILTVSMVIAVMFASNRTNFQPWYLLYVIPFAAFVAKKYFILIPLFILSFAGLLQYLPYLYTGGWDAPIPSILNYMMITGIFISFLIVAVRFFQNKVNS